MDGQHWYSFWQIKLFRESLADKNSGPHSMSNLKFFVCKVKPEIAKLSLYIAMMESENLPSFLNRSDSKVKPIAPWSLT